MPNRSDKTHGALPTFKPCNNVQKCKQIKNIHVWAVSALALLMGKNNLLSVQSQIR